MNAKKEKKSRTRELRLSGPVAKSEWRVARNFFTFSSAKDTSFRISWVQLAQVGTECERLGTEDLEGNTELRHSAYSQLELAVVPFEEREDTWEGSILW